MPFTTAMFCANAGAAAKAASNTQRRVFFKVIGSFLTGQQIEFFGRVRRDCEGVNAALHGIGQRIIHQAVPCYAGLSGECGRTQS